MFLQQGYDFIISVRQFLGQYSRLADDRHEIAVALPARNNMQMQVIFYPGAGSLAFRS